VVTKSAVRPKPIPSVLPLSFTTTNQTNQSKESINHFVQCLCGANLVKSAIAIKEHRRCCDHNFNFCHRPKCLAIFADQKQLNQHQKVVHFQERLDAKTHHCDHPKCHKSFSTAALLSKHKLCGKHNSSRFQCPICKKGFAERLKMEYHQRTHFKDKPEICKFCKKSFTNPSTLGNHIKTIHGTAMKPFSCRKCGKRFAKESLLKAHWKTHGTKKVNVEDKNKSNTPSMMRCPYCPDGDSKRYTRWSSVQRHCRDKHPNEVVPKAPPSKQRKSGMNKEYRCEHCTSSFVSKSNKRKHLRRHHPDLIPVRPLMTSDG